MKTTLAGTLAAAALAAVPAPAAAATSPCRTALKEKGVEVVAKSRTSVVFYRARKPFPYGCHLRKSPRAYQLKDICCQGEKFKVRGHYLGFVFRGSADGDETDRVGVYDLLTGKRKKIGGQPYVDRQDYVPSFVVTSRGGLAWLEKLTGDDGEETGVTEVHAVAPAAGAPDRTLDSGTSIAKLLLSADEETVSWLKDGTRTSAPLTP